MQRARYVDDILVPLDISALFTFTSSPSEPPVPKAPRFELPPGDIPAKTPVEIKVHGRPRIVAACVARVIEAVVQGAKTVRCRPETIGKLRQQVPELVLRRDVSKKILSNTAWYAVG